MQYSAKTMLLAMSIVGIVMTLVIGQMVPVLAQSIPTSSNLVKRDMSVMDDQHTTALYGNDKVCGDHLCAPGEWSKLQANLNQAQITPSKVIPTKTVSVSSNVTTTVSTNSTLPVPPPKPITSPPAPIPTPPPVQSSICVTVKAALANSTISADVVTKVMSDLGCNK